MVYLRTWYLVPGTVQVSTTVFPVPGVLVPGTGISLDNIPGRFGSAHFMRNF